MTATRHPLIELVYNDETGRYIGMLERKLLKLQLDDLKFRALLELLTGDSWDDYSFSAEDDEIKKLAQDALSRRLQISPSDARKLVNERWEAHNPGPPDESTRTYLVGPQTGQPKPRRVVPQSATVQRVPGVDFDKHLRGIKQSREHMRAQQD